MSNIERAAQWLELAVRFRDLGDRKQMRRCALISRVMFERKASE